MIRGGGGARQGAVAARGDGRRATTATGGARRVAATMARCVCCSAWMEDNGAGRGTARGLYPRKIFSPGL